LIIPLQIKDSTYLFLWDSGSAHSWIYPETIEKLGIDNKSKDEWVELSGVKEVIIDTFQTKRIDIRLGDISFRTIFFLDNGIISQFAPKLNFQIKGVIGQNIISEFYWLFDFKKMNVTLSEEEMNLGNAINTFSLPFQLSKKTRNIPVVKLNIGDSIKNVPFNFDTGYSLSCSIFDKYLLLPGLIINDSLYTIFTQKVRFLSIKIQKGENAKESILLCDSIIINQKKFSGISMVNRNHYNYKNYITANFLFLFDKMYYNPTDKTIKLIHERNSVNGIDDTAEAFKLIEKHVRKNRHCCNGKRIK
jgi:hypothetical protein